MNLNREMLRSGPAIAIALVIACGVGFLVARWTAPAPQLAGTASSEALPMSVAVSQEGLAAVGITTEKVTTGDIAGEVIAPATIDPEIHGEAMLTAHVAGTVSSITGRVGDKVKAGATLAVVISRDAAAIAAAQATADARLVQARAALAREQTLFAKQVTPREELERAQADFDAAAADARRARATAAVSHVRPDGTGVAIVSPISGTVVSRTATLGLFVQPESELFQVADPEDIDIDAAVPAQDAQRIAAGDAAKVRTRAGVLVNAKVRSVTPTLNDATRSATAVLDPLPGQAPLMPGDVLTAEIIPSGAAKTGIVVPADAVQTLEGRDVVFVRTPTGFAARPVTVGARSAGHAAIVAGLRPGEIIATANAFFLKAEMRKPTGEE